jgi:hypothetical protein
VRVPQRVPGSLYEFDFAAGPEEPG